MPHGHGMNHHIIGEFKINLTWGNGEISLMMDGWMGGAINQMILFMENDK